MLGYLSGKETVWLWAWIWWFGDLFGRKACKVLEVWGFFLVGGRGFFCFFWILGGFLLGLGDFFFLIESTLFCTAKEAWRKCV